MLLTPVYTKRGVRPANLQTDPLPADRNVADLQSMPAAPRRRCPSVRSQATSACLNHMETRKPPGRVFRDFGQPFQDSGLPAGGAPSLASSAPIRARTAP